MFRKNVEASRYMNYEFNRLINQKQNFNCFEAVIVPVIMKSLKMSKYIVVHLERL